MFKFGNQPITMGAPLSGMVTLVSQLSDPVFREDVLGKGIAILPNGTRVLAPADGVVEQMFDTGHAVSITTDSGVELLIHIGVDTVKLRGRHFVIHKNNGDRVKAGDLLMEFDGEAIAGEGFETISPVVVCNPDAFKSIVFAPQGPIREGEPMITLKK